MCYECYGCYGKLKEVIASLERDEKTGEKEIQMVVGWNAIKSIPLSFQKYIINIIYINLSI